MSLNFLQSFALGLRDAKESKGSSNEGKYGIDPEEPMESDAQGHRWKELQGHEDHQKVEG